MPVAVWGAYLNITAWYMYQELNREALALDGAAVPRSVPSTVGAL